MEEIELKVTIDEANLILEGLGLLPFARVYELVGKLQEQAAQQVRDDQPQADVATLELSDSAARG